MAAKAATFPKALSSAPVVATRRHDNFCCHVEILPSAWDDADAIVTAFDDNVDDAYSVTDSATLAELRAAASARTQAEGRREAAALAAHSAGLSWGVIGAQLGMTRQGTRQRFERLVNP